MRKTNTVDKVEEPPKETLADYCERLGDYTLADEDREIDEDEIFREYTTATMTIPEEPDDLAIVIRAHLEYTKSGEKHYAISDSGADSCILGGDCHVVSHTNRSAYLVGYDPATTRSSKISIITGLIKVMSQDKVPIVLVINEAPYNANSPVTLISEYQARDYGTIIDSVSRRHKTISGEYGTQRIMVSATVWVPLVDRGGLMGFEILPWVKGDEDNYETYVLTSDEKWTPRRYLENDDSDEESQGIADVFATSQDIEEFSEALQDEPEEQTDEYSDALQDMQDDESSESSGLSVVAPSKIDDGADSSLSSTSHPLDNTHFMEDNHSTIKKVLLETTRPVVPTGMVIPTPAIWPEREPYYFDPSDEEIKRPGRVVANLLSVPVYDDMENYTVDNLVTYLSYRDLTGYEEFDMPCYEGYPGCTLEEPIPDEDFSTLFARQELDPEIFDTRLFAVASWHRVLHKNLDPSEIQPYLGYAPLKVIRKTLDVTTQNAKMILRTPLRRHIKSRLGFMQAKRLDETVSTDPMFANCKSLGSGYTGAQVFYGLKSTQIDVYGFHRKGEFPHIYRDFIREQGAPSALRRDNAKEEHSAAVDEIHRELLIKDQFCEPYHPQQNTVESRAIKYLKDHVHVLLDRTGAPDNAWFHAAQYLAGVHSVLSNPNLPDQMTPRQRRTGVTPDISPWLQFTFWQPILYLDNENSWPSTRERVGRWLGVAENIGDFLTYWIFDDQSRRVLARSVVRPFNRNRRVKWDPLFARQPIRETAQIGGDKKYSKEEIEAALNDVSDIYDEAEPDPKPRTFDRMNDPVNVTNPVIKGSVMKDPTYLDTSQTPFVPKVFSDTYGGDSKLRLTSKDQPLSNEIPKITIQGKERYKNIKYPSDYVPEEQKTEVELPKKVKMNEPVVDPVARVKKKEEEPPPLRRSSRVPKKIFTIPPMKKNNKSMPNEPSMTTEEPKTIKPQHRTIWSPSNMVKTLFLVSALGHSLLPSTIVAEPLGPVKEHSLAGLFTDVDYLKPLDTDVQLEQLRAYHARLDVLNELESPDLSKSDWDVALIERYAVQWLKDDTPDIRFNVVWVGGDKQWVKMKDLRLHDPLLVLRYGLRHHLTRLRGWEWVESFVNQDGELSRIIHAYRVSKGITYKFGVQVPNNTREALRLDSAATETLWTQAIDAELQQINDYEVFRVLEDDEPIPLGYKLIPYHCVYDVKFDGRRKCRLVAGGHRTDPPKEDIFSGVVSMEAVRLGFILARLNGLLACAGDVGNAFLYTAKPVKRYMLLQGKNLDPTKESA